jgi:folate-binding protein YgfZ
MAMIIEKDTAVADTAAWFLALNSMAITEVSGEDSCRFLQGQLSCNVQKLNKDHSLRGALCNLKGRVIANLRVVQGADDVLLLSRTDLQEKILATLNKYRVFFKTSLKVPETTYCIYGLGGGNLAAVLGKLGVALPELADSCIEYQGLTFIRMPGSALYDVPRYLLIFKSDSVPAVAFWQNLQPLLVQESEMKWTVADIRTGQAHPDVSQSELFTPQLLNYDINGVIDFKKGCYTGQEIVARMFYKADAKRRLYYLDNNRASDVSAGDGISVPPEDVVMSSRSVDGRIESLVILNCEQAELMSNVFGFDSEKHSSESGR